MSHLRGAVDGLPLRSSSLPGVCAHNVCQVAPTAPDGGDEAVPPTGLHYALQPLVLRRVVIIAESIVMKFPVLMLDS